MPSTRKSSRRPVVIAGLSALVLGITGTTTAAAVPSSVSRLAGEGWYDTVATSSAADHQTVGDGNRILATPSAGLERLQQRARDMGGNDLFVDEMTPALYRAAVRYGIDPTVMVAQSFHETAGGVFGRAVTPEHHNTCGLKVRNPVGPDTNPDDHATFASWDIGATAHAQHLLAYTGTPLPRGDTNVDPRWDWVFGKHAVETLTDLGGKWAPSPMYGDRLHATALRLLG